MRSSTRFVCLQKLIRQPQTPTEFYATWTRSQKVVSRALDEVIVVLDSFEDSAEALGRFEQREVRLRQQFMQPVRRGQPANAAANHGDAWLAGFRISNRSLHGR
jgi:hypothetical protein